MIILIFEVRNHHRNPSAMSEVNSGKGRFIVRRKHRNPSTMTEVISGKGKFIVLKKRCHPWATGKNRWTTGHRTVTGSTFHLSPFSGIPPIRQCSFLTGLNVYPEYRGMSPPIEKAAERNASTLPPETRRVSRGNERGFQPKQASFPGKTNGVSERNERHFGRKRMAFRTGTSFVSGDGTRPSVERDAPLQISGLRTSRETFAS